MENGNLQKKLVKISFELVCRSLWDVSPCIIPALSVAASFNSLFWAALWKNIWFSFTFITWVPNSVMEVNSRCKIHRIENIKANLAVVSQSWWAMCYVVDWNLLFSRNPTQGCHSQCRFWWRGRTSCIGVCGLPGSGCAQSPSALRGRCFQVLRAAHVSTCAMK